MLWPPLLVNVRPYYVDHSAVAATQADWGGLTLQFSANKTISGTSLNILFAVVGVL